MTSESQDMERLRRAMQDRLARRPQLTSSLDRHIYYERAFLGARRFGSALVVGVGHGHDALLSLLDGRFERADGVDPYHADHGNDSTDHQHLLALISELGLTARFEVHRMEIQDFLASCERRYDLILLPDVLHHIFVTDQPLRKSALYAPCRTLFGALRGVAAPGAVLAISDAPRSGLRPSLVRHGVLRSTVDYRTKQAAEEWRAAAQEAGWRFESADPYVPYALRHLRGLLKWPPLPWLYADRYFLRFSAAG